MSAPLVAFREVTKRFGEGPAALDRLSLDVGEGDFVSLIGPSGCGKSTLLRLAAGLTPLSRGTIAVAGRQPEDAAAELAFVFQDPTLLPWLTAAENVALPAQLRPRGAGQPPAHTPAEALALVRLADRAGAYPRQLSGGQRMRVSLARALAAAPRLLLLDEPFGALDEMTREHLNEELLALRARQSWTALFVTHSVAEAVFLSNRIIVLAAGPGRIHAEVPIPLAYPRTGETRLAPEFHQLVERVSRLLRAVDPHAA